MDDALRRLERGGDPLAYATALRRAGDDVRARRVVEGRVRAGDVGAREVLDAWWPVDERVLRVVARAMQPGHAPGYVLKWLFAEEDPRLTPTIAPLIARLEAFAGDQRIDQARLAEFIEPLKRPFDQRRQLVIGGNDVMRLSRARLDPDEAASLLARVETTSWDIRPSLLSSAIWHVGRARAVQCTTALQRHAAGDDRLIAFEATSALYALGVEAPFPVPALLTGLPFRPGWVSDRSPGETRDAPTGALTRGAFMNDPFDPLESREALDMHVDGWLLSAAGPKATMLATRVTRAMQASVGDRVGISNGWLIRLEADLEPRSIAEGLRTAVAAAVGVKMSIGVARGTTWLASIAAAGAARTVAEQEGGDRVRFAP